MTTTAISKDTTDIRPLREDEFIDPSILTIEEIKIKIIKFQMTREKPRATRATLRSYMRKIEKEILQGKGRRLITNIMAQNKDLLNPHKRKSL